MKLLLTPITIIYLLISLGGSPPMSAQSPIKVTTNTSANDNSDDCESFFGANSSLYYYIKVFQRTSILKLVASTENVHAELIGYRIYKIVNGLSHNYSNSQLTKGTYLIKLDYLLNQSFVNPEEIEADISLSGYYYFKRNGNKYGRWKKFNYMDNAFFDGCGELIDDAQSSDAFKTVDDSDLVLDSESNDPLNTYKYISLELTENLQNRTFTFINSVAEIPLNIYLINLQNGQVELLQENKYFNEGFQSASLDGALKQDGIYKIIVQQGSTTEKRTFFYQN